jgi:hypothetical protein
VEVLGNMAAVVTTILTALAFVAILVYLFVPILTQMGITRKPKEESLKIPKPRNFLQRHKTNSLAHLWFQKRVNFHQVQGIRASTEDFSNSKLNGLDFHDSELPDANFEGSDLQKANFSHTNLWHANFKDCQLAEADFTEADLQDADLRNANLEDAKLEKAHLKGAIFNRNTRLPFPSDQARGRGMIFVAS